MSDSNGAAGFEYYDPAANSTKPLVPGVYPCHVTECNIREDVIVRGKYLSKVYNLKLKVDSSVTKHNFSYKNINGEIKEATGEAYVDRNIYGSGIFFFYTPTKSEHSHLKPNPGGNDTYLDFCRSFGYDCKEIEIEDAKGIKRKVNKLPELSSEDLIGKPILANVNYGKPYKDKNGEQRTPIQAKGFSTWSDGNEIDVEADALPF